jgi:Flp pilus assembly pilin Flp
MTPIEWGLLFGVIARSVAIITALIKLVAWVTSHMSVVEQKIKSLEHQVNKDVTGRRVVGEMREDLASIKTQITDMRSDIHYLRKKVST